MNNNCSNLNITNTIFKKINELDIQLIFNMV